MTFSEKVLLNSDESPPVYLLNLVQEKKIFIRLTANLESLSNFGETKLPIIQLRMLVELLECQWTLESYVYVILTPIQKERRQHFVEMSTMLKL